MNGWDQLPFWLSEDWLTAQEKLDGEVAGSLSICPSRDRIFRALDETPLDQVRAAIIGQDPYPNPACATGLAFSIPKGVANIPPTLRTILREYSDDLHLPIPTHGDLSSWCSSGVLLWNALPTCLCFKSMSHDWPEWRRLTNEILEFLCKRGVVIVLVGSVARRHAETVNYFELVNPGENVCIEVSHPSPRGRAAGRSPFVGSRLFSKINAGCVSLGYEPVNWELPR